MSKPEAKRASQHDAVKVRLAVNEDAAAISVVLLSSFGQNRENYTPAAFVIVTPPEEEIAGRFLEGPQWVADLDGKVIGTVGVTHEPEGLYIRSLGVAPEAQGQGVASRMLDAIDEYASTVDTKRIFLYTTYFVPAAVKLYEKHGYKWVRDTTADEWYGTPGLEMDKILRRDN
ncbi:MAG: GNAT family N-acetyltransferase [Acidobacteriota bacterium]